MKILFSLTLVFFLFHSGLTFSQNTERTKKYKNLVILDAAPGEPYKPGTLIILNTTTSDTTRRSIPEYRYGYFINAYGLMLAKIGGDAKALLNRQGIVLNGPFEDSDLRFLWDGLIFTGKDFHPGSRAIVFNARGDSLLLISPSYEYPASDTTLVTGINPKTKRQEKGIFSKEGSWIVKSYMNKEGQWISKE